MQHSTRANYEVVRQLGEGGVGRVYEAVHHPSGRVVAIKTLRTEHGSASSQRLLLNEAAAAAQLAHPAIVEILDVGRDDHGAMFLVMELVRGSSLEAWGASFPGLPVALRAFDEILDALATAHAQGIVHGDLKPGNVLLTDDGRVKVTDFGIAHVIDPLRRAERRGVQGTPYYMAPEQLLDLESIGPATDLYAIGVMLYELVAGREPYGAEGTLGDMVARKLAQVAPLVPRKGLSVPRELTTLVMSLLEPDPRLRPRFAAQVRRSLAEVALLVQAERPSASSLVERSLATWIESPLGSAPTITSSEQLPQSMGSTRSLPFSLPCLGGYAPEVALHRLRPLPLLGRREQTERLMGLAREVVAGAGPRGVIVSGRPGEGKTRLLRHGFAEMERTGAMIGAAASFDETIANVNVGVRAGITRLLGGPLPTVAESLESRWKWLTRVPQPDVDFGAIHEWLAPNARAFDPKSAARIAAMAVLAASRIHPIYLWLDDVAWSRDGAMELMVRLLDEGSARVLVVGSLRSGTAEHPAVRAWLLEAARVGAHFEMLPPLSATDRVALLEAAGDLKPELATALAAELDEPTLVLVEAVRAWIDEGWLVAADDGHHVLRDGARASDLVARARESVIDRRVATLLRDLGEERANAERVLCHAALLGLRFDERALRACEGVAGHVDRVLDRALLAGLLRVDGRAGYRFEHRLFLDVIVDRCAQRPDAKEIFRATADALTAVYGKRSLETGLATAQLYRAGGANESAVRRAAETVRAFVGSSLFDAADRAVALLASWNEADRAGPGHLHDAILEHARGIRAYFALDYAGAREHLERARATFEALGAIGDLHVVLFDISSTYFYEDHFADAKRYIAYVDQPIVDPLAHARGHHRLAEIAAMHGDVAGAIEHQKRSLVVNSDRDVYFTLVGEATLAEYYLANDDVAGAAIAVERGRVAAEKVGGQIGRRYFNHTLSALDAARGYYAAARARTIEHLEEFVARGDKWHTTSERALLMLCSSELDEAPERAAAVRAFIDAYTAVPHDEAFTWWSVRASAKRLRARGDDALADQLSTLLDARMKRIALAFDEEQEPITEDEAAR